MSAGQIRTNPRGADVALAVSVVLACLVRLYLAGTQSYWALSGGYDDALQAQQAANLLQGLWLGEYSQTTLIKGISYPLFLAIGHSLNLKYGLTLGIAICLACLVFLGAMRKYSSNRLALFGAFCLLLFCPIAWGSDAGLRIYRNALAPWAALAIFSCLFALYQVRKSRTVLLLPWLVLLGLVLAFMVNLREDGIWAYPAICITLIVVAKAQMGAPPQKSVPKAAVKERSEQAHSPFSLLFYAAPQQLG